MNNSSLLDPSTREKVSKLPAFMQYAVGLLTNAIGNIIDGNCDEDVILKAVNTVNDNSNGRYKDDELLNYDKAGIMLGFGTTNRVGLKRLLDKHGIKGVVINNRKCGFPKIEILNLKDKICKKH